MEGNGMQLNDFFFFNNNIYHKTFLLAKWSFYDSSLSLPLLSPWAQLRGTGHCGDGDKISRAGWVFRRTEAEIEEEPGSFG